MTDTDFDALIDDLEQAKANLYGKLVTAQEANVLNDRCDIARSALREAIASLQWDYDEAMLQYNNAQKRACDAEARVAALEAEYEEAMQFILAVNQPHDYDCANYRNEMKPCDCGFQNLVDAYLSKRGQG